MNLKIDKKLIQDLNNIAEMEYSTPEAILMRGLIIYTKYAQRLNLTGKFKGKEGIKDAEKYIEDLAATYCTDTNEIVFGCIDAYRAKVIGLTLSERLEVSGREEIYSFIEDPFRGYLLCTYNKGDKVNTLTEIMKIKREQDKIEREDMLKIFIENAREQLIQSEKELKQIKNDYDKANIEYTRISTEHQVLNATEIFKFTAKQRIDHKNKIERKNNELGQISAKTTILGEKLNKKKNEMQEIKNDINTMNRYFSFEEIPLWKVKEKYKSNNMK